MNPSSNQKEYTALEDSYFQSTGVRAPGFNTGTAVDLFASTSFLYSLAIMICVVTAGAMYMRAGLYRMQASESGVRKSNEEIKRVTFGLLGVLSLFVILYTFNKGLLTGTVSLDVLKTSGIVPGGGGVFGGGGATGDTGGTSTPEPGNQITCTDPKTVISSLTSQKGVCGNAQCAVLSGCTYQQYLPIIQREASRVGVDAALVVALMCRESRGRADAKSTLPENGTNDCGLMQINQKGACDAAILDPATNIARGVELIKQKMSSSNQVYQNIPQQLGAYASYNCCGNGTVPNAPSIDCTTATGFPYAIPKWACPINPGQGKFNMCFVKNYTCEIDACVKELSGISL